MTVASAKKALMALALLGVLALTACDTTDTLAGELLASASTSSGSATAEVPPASSLPIQNQKAAAAFDRVLSHGDRVLWTKSNQYLYLGECRFPYLGDALGGSTLSMSLVDLDGDKVEELIIGDSDRIVLRYADGDVYAYPFTFRAMDAVCTDGTVSYRNAEEYGMYRLRFDGYTFECEYLWHERFSNEGDKYFIGDKSVTEDELRAYTATLGHEKAATTAITVPAEIPTETD